MILALKNGAAPFLVAMVSLVAVAPALAASYICEAKAEYTVDGGFLERESDLWIDLSRRFVFDEETGSLTRDKMEPVHMTVFQRGTTSNGVIAVVQFRGPASFVFMSIRIRTYENPISFIFDDNSSLTSGVCERVGK